MTHRAIIACGGTGGHMAPGIALAEELVSRGWECTLLISNKQVDSRLVKKYGQFKYECIDGLPFSGRPDRMLRFLLSLTRGTMKCRRLIRQLKPDVVVGFGGFLSMPAMLAGFLSGLPTIIHEANRVAGRVTRIVSRFASRIYLPDGVSIGSDRKGRIRYLGMPVRDEITKLDKVSAKESLGFDPQQKLLAVMGGSQGAQSLNTWANDSLPALAEKQIQVFCLTGGSESDRASTLPSLTGNEVRSIFRSFSDEMALVLSAADFVVSRSGAGSIAEMIRCRVPGVLVPYPYSADDHQIANAEKFESLGCGILLPQGGLSEMLDHVIKAISDESILQTYQEKLEWADQHNVRSIMAEDIKRIVSGEDLDPFASLKEGGVA